MTRAQELAAIVRAAHRRLFVCEVHQVRRPSPETCPLCMLERQCTAQSGRPVAFRSMAQIMGATPGGGWIQ